MCVPRAKYKFNHICAPMSIYQSCHLPNFFKRVLFHFSLCVPFRSISSESKHTDVISEGVKHSHDTFSRTYQTLFHFYFKPKIRQKADTDIASIIVIILIRNNISKPVQILQLTLLDFNNIKFIL